jgi:hypothetical protein
VRRLLALIGGIILVGLLLVAGAWWRGLVTLPIGPNRRELAVQLRDRGTVAVAGPIPLGLRRDEATLRDYSNFPRLATALNGTNAHAVAPAVSAEHLDGLLVRTDRALGTPGSMVRRMSEMLPVEGMGATFMDDAAALYESAESISIEPADARRLVAVVRLVLQGAVPPPERLFPESVRRSRPTEVTVILRDGHESIIWRAVRGGSIARALVDATYAVLDRWNTRQQQRFGPIREAILAHPLTIAIFHDRGTLGSRTDEFIRRAANPRVFAIGYEHLGRWEYVLPPMPWGPAQDPVQAIAALVREHDVPPPGYRRPELTLYRFRAYQIVEREPQGEVDIFDPQ